MGNSEPDILAIGTRELHNGGAEKSLIPIVTPGLDGSIESTVSWIAQDSTSNPDEYLEECNTNQNGE